MLAFTFNFLMFAGGGEGGGAFQQFYDHYLNVPGFEVWKFINLAIFAAIMIYLAKKPLGEAFKTRRDKIRAELIRAEEEKQAALAKLITAEAKLAELETEKQQILSKAQAEADFEKQRLAEQTAIEIERLRLQKESELARLTAQTRSGLRRFSAEESIRLAEEKLRAQIDTVTDAKLVKASIQEIGGLN
jgi:F0F1-type ATP synthase membrane subunit b/b'